MSFEIRPYHPSDLTSLYHICLKTGDNGKDATDLFRDRDLIGHYYAAPYAIYQPELCFVLTQNYLPIGYVLGVAETSDFVDWFNSEWLPPLRQRYPKPTGADNQSKDGWIIHNIHRETHGVKMGDRYPAHLHIDILPTGQRKGFGRQLIERLCHALAARSVPGVCLGVGRANQNAIGFYHHVGFKTLDEGAYGAVLGKRLLV